MNVSELYDDMRKLLEDGKGNYDVMIRVADDDEKRDLITHICNVKSFSPNIGYVELTSVNNVYLDWRK